MENLNLIESHRNVNDEFFRTVLKDSDARRPLLKKNTHTN